MERINLVGLVGRSGSGKTTVSAHLVLEHEFVHYSLGSPLKTAARELFGFTLHQLYGDLREVPDPVTGITPRVALQKLGSLCYELDEYSMVRRVAPKVRTSLRQGQSVVIDDLRRPSQVKYIIEEGGVVIHLVRYDLDDHSDLHESEDTEWIIGDQSVRTISNVSTIEHLHEQVRQIVFTPPEE